MKRISKVLFPTTIFYAAVALCAGLFINNAHSSIGYNDYSITFNSTTNHLHNDSGSQTGSTDNVKTSRNQPVSFSYVNVIGDSESWHYVGIGGSFQNTSRINGISNLNMKFNSEGFSFKIEWSKDADFSDLHSKTYTSGASNTCDFDSYSPNYFRFVNLSNNYINIDSMTLNFACVIRYPTINITNENSLWGDIHSSIPNGAVEVGTKFRIAAAGKNEHTFDGWYSTDTNEKYSSDLILDLTVGNVDINLEARYKAVTDNKYQVFTKAGDNGSVAGNGKYTVNEQVTLISTPNNNYCSLGWFNVDDTQSEEMKNPTYVFNMPSKDLCYVSKFSQLYNINCSVDALKGSVSGPNKAYAGQQVSLTANPNYDNEYAFDCWEDEDHEELSQDRTYSFVMPDHDITLHTEFKKGIKLTVLSSNTDYGTVDGSGYYLEGREATLTASCKNDNVFLGWYDSDQYIGSVSLSSSYKYTLGSSGTTLYARFLTASEYLTWANAHGGIPTDITDTTLNYGLYPQSHVNDSSLITELAKYAPSADEEYFIYNNDYYVKDTGNPYDSDYMFNDGTKVVKGSTYYFKCEPIKWNILSSGNDIYSLDCSNILNAQCYGENYSGRKNKTDYQGNTGEAYANNYEFSGIRNWLNVTFYNQSFLNNSYIQTTNVDNSAATTNNSSNVYACDNTSDKVYLRSYQDWNSQAGLSIAKKVSDYALCNYVYMNTWFEENRNGNYWTRSPGSTHSYDVSIVNSGGNLGLGEVNCSDAGISPSLTIKTK